MATLKTQKTTASVSDFVAAIPEEKRRSDCETLLHLMEEITGHAPVLWGASIVGFGEYHYRYASGREGDWFLTGFSPRKRNLTIYVMSCFAGCEHLMDRLGKHKTGKSCLYTKQLDDINMQVLREVLILSVTYVREKMHVPR